VALRKFKCKNTELSLTGRKRKPMEEWFWFRHKG